MSANQIQPDKPITKASFESKPTAVLVLDNGTVFEGKGFGAETVNVGEVCFNTSMTGYQEIMTDPSYAGQLITFTFPHIGNIGTNPVDIETDVPACLGMIVRNELTSPSNWRDNQDLSSWLAHHNLPGIAGIDTRALTQYIRDNGAPRGVICHQPDGQFDIPALQKMAQDWPGLKGMDLAKSVTRDEAGNWEQGSYDLDAQAHTSTSATHKVVALDYGIKQNIMRCLVDAGCDVTVMPATSTADEILAQKPDGVFLSNGPGDPAATADYTGAEIAKIVDADLPVFGICIGHQLLVLSQGGKTVKMERGHRGANHPVKDLQTGQIEITSQNHGFMVDEDSLPDHLEVTHRSLFDGSVEGVRHKSKPMFCVQYHPESSPGPHDSTHLFTRFTDMMSEAKSEKGNR